MSVSDCISAIGVLVSLANVGVAGWVGYTLQTALTTKRAIKDILIKRIEVLSDKYDSMYSNLVNDSVDPRMIIPWFKSFYIESQAVLDKLNQMYDCKIDYLVPFQIDLRELITNDESFENCFNKKSFKLSTQLRNDLHRFHKENHHLFLDLICEINSSKRG